MKNNLSFVLGVLLCGTCMEVAVQNTVLSSTGKATDKREKGL